MRIHERFSFLWPMYDRAFVARLLRAEALVAVRLEPVYSLRYEAYMDALFEHDGQWLVVSFLRVDGASIMAPENPPITWPAGLAAFNGPQIDEIDAKITPWLRSIAAARMVNEEHIRFWRDTPALRSDVEQAREAGFLGATTYPDVVRSVGAAVYALRLVRDGRVALRGPNAPNAAAILSSVVTGLDVECSDFARRWFAGIDFGSINLGANYICFIGPRAHPVEARYCVFDDGSVASDERNVALVEPVPSDVMLSFDPQDGPVSRNFSVTECAVPVRRLPFGEPPVSGGSAGVVRLLVREDAQRFSDADLDGARALAERLRAEGFDADVATASHVDPAHVDVVHIFGLHHGASLVELLRALEQRNTPVVVSTYADDRRGEATSGTSGALLIPRAASDVIAFYDYAAAFERRKISNLTAGSWYDDVSRLIMRRCACALVVAPAEAQYLRDSLSYFGPTVLAPAFVPLTYPTADIGSLVGSDEFVLVHAPIEPRGNQVFAALAAARLGFPMVLLGPVADIEFYRYVCELSGPQVIQLRDDELTPQEIAGLYARARVIADISWSTRGIHRLARGAAFGGAVVASAQSYAAEVWSGLGCCLVDPASLDSIVDGIRTAWERQPIAANRLISATAVVADPFTNLVAVVSAYQQASVPARS